MIKIRQIIISCFFLVSFCSFGQKKVLVYGSVTNENNQPIQIVEVSVENSTIRTQSDLNGRYELSFDAPKDTFNLCFGSIGFILTKKQIIIKNSAKYPLNVKMKESVHQLDDVLVEGRQLQTTTSQSVNTDNFKLLPTASGNSVESLIKSFSGVSSSNELSSQYSVRGGSFDENSVYVNGIEVYRPYLVRSGEQEGLSFINPDMVGSLNFSAGGFDVRYGDKLSSVLDITYKRPEQFEASVSGSFGGATAYIGTASDKFTQMHGVRYKNSSYLLGSLQTKGEYNPNFVDYQTFMTYRMTPKAELSFLGNVSQNIYNFVPQTRSTTFGPLESMQNFTVYFDGQEKDAFRTFFGALSANYKPTKTVSLDFTFSAFNTHEQEAYDIKGEYWLNKVASAGDEVVVSDELGVGTYYEHARDEMNVSVFKIAHNGSLKLNSNNTIIWGVDAMREIVSDFVQEWEMRDSAGYSLPYNSTDVNLYYSLSSSNNLTTTRAHGYLQEVYKLYFGESILAFTGGLRLCYWTFNNELTASPRLTVAYLPDWEHKINFRFATGIYYQSPSYKEIKDTVTINGNLTNYLNKDIVSQQSLQFVLGADYFFNLWERPFKFTTELYYKDMKNLISYNIDNVKINYLGRNDAKGYAAGVDMKFYGEFVPGLDSWLSLSLMNTMEDKEGDNYGYQPRPMDQLYNISIFFQDYVPGFPKYRVHLMFNWAQGFPVSASNTGNYSSTARMPDYRRIDIGLSRVFEKNGDPFMEKWIFTFVKKMSIGVEVLNLFGFNNVNSYYWVTDIYNQQYAVPNYLTGRQLNLKFQLDF